MSPGNPYLHVGIRGELLLPADKREEWLATWKDEYHYLGGNEFYSVVEAYSIAMGVSDGANRGSMPGAGHQWQLHEASGNWADAGPLRLRGWMQLGLYGNGAGGDGYAVDHLDSPPSFAALRMIWDSLRSVGDIALGGVDVEAPLWLVGEAFWIKVDMAHGVLDEHAPHDDVLVEIGTSDPADEEVRAAILTALERYSNTTSATVLPGTTSRRDMQEEVETLICDPSESSGVIALRLTPAAWSIDTASWVADAAIISCHKAGLRGLASISVRRWQSSYQ